jgi:hypothetical protein
VITAQAFEAIGRPVDDRHAGAVLYDLRLRRPQQAFVAEPLEKFRGVLPQQDPPLAVASRPRDTSSVRTNEALTKIPSSAARQSRLATTSSGSLTRRRRPVRFGAASDSDSYDEGPKVRVETVGNADLQRRARLLEATLAAAQGAGDPPAAVN